MISRYNHGAVVFDNWKIKRKIGEGSFGQVFEIQRQDFGETYHAALKVITVPQSEVEFQSALEEGMTQRQAEQYFYSIVEDIVREFAIMSRLKGTANVVSYEDHRVVRKDSGVGWDILIRMELLHPLLPYAYQHPLSRRNIIQLGIDMCKALELCQKYNIIHRDIKPENIFVNDNGDFKLGDFGIARTIEKTMSGLSKKGTYSYMAPEVYRGADYGFGVDIYSLGIVLYRLLNKNRVPFLPPAPEPITFNSRELALAKRMGGEQIPKPFYAEGRLAEIVLKASAYDPKDRYSSPAQMRQELEAILYDQSEAEYIYPDGDELALAENEYASGSAGHKNEKESAATSKTSSAFGGRIIRTREDSDKVENMGASQGEANLCDMTGKTEKVFGVSRIDATDKTKSTFKKQDRSKQENVKQSSKKNLSVKLWIATGICIVFFIIGGIFLYLNHQKQQALEKTENYQQLMQDGNSHIESAPEQAIEEFKRAQGLFPEETAPYISIAFALYSSQNYDDCISYIEDELAMGKHFDQTTQERLSEILGAAYFEKNDYAAAASFFRFSTAGGDITVSAMRDYAVSLGRLGDVDAADAVLKKMIEAGADDNVTNYVQAEVDYARKDFLSAERGFQSVLNTTEDIVLQKRALRSLGEVYRDCAALARINESPIDCPATKAAEILSDGIVRYGLRFDSTLWEMLALAYFEAYHTDISVPQDYINKAADCFNRVIELGVQKDYLYSNLYTIYYEMGNYEKAEQSLKDYETAFPNDYMPHALRGMMLISIESEKDQLVRDYSPAVQEYERAGEMIKGSDDATYYQQLESLIIQLEENGWIT